MKILVTGANGFLARDLVKKLLGSGHHVVTLSRAPVNFSHSLLTSVVGDLNSIDTLLHDESFDAVHHTAAKINFDDTAESIRSIIDDNIMSAYALADLVIKNGIKKVILSSTCSVYEENFKPDTLIDENNKLRPWNLYAVSKLSCEWILESKLRGIVNEFVILRYSSIYGYGQNPATILPIFIKKATSADAITIFGSGKRVQDYVYIDDVVQANIKCLQTELPFGTIFNIGSGEPVSDEMLANTIVKVWDSTSEIKILHQNANAETVFVYNIEKAKNMIGYVPVKLHEGLKLYRSMQAKYS